MTTRAPLVVVVNRHNVAANRKAIHVDDRKPVFRISRGKHGKPSYASELKIEGNARLVYDPDHPLPCGATVWLEIEEIAA